MGEIVVLAENETRVAGEVIDGRVRVDGASLDKALGWELKPQGLCRGEVCVPVADQAALELDGGYDLAAVASALDSTALVDADLGVVAVSRSGAERGAAVHDMVAPELVLPDLTGTQVSTAGFKGKKKLLVVFASW